MVRPHQVRPGLGSVKIDFVEDIDEENETMEGFAIDAGGHEHTLMDRRSYSHGKVNRNMYSIPEQRKGQMIELLQRRPRNILRRLLELW